MRVLDVDGPLRDCRQSMASLRTAASKEPCHASTSADAVTITVQAAHGFAFPVSKGSRFRVVDLHGQQVVDFMAWTRSSSKCTITGLTKHTANLSEKVSMAYTRFHLSGAPPAVGESLWTNTDKALLTVTADTCRVHDMTFMSCFPELYQKQGLENHRSCASNIAEAMKDWGMGSYLDIADPFNIFQNTPHYTLKGNLNPSRKGDYIEFEASEDCVCAVSSCPYEMDGFNGGKITDVAVVVEGKDNDLRLHIDAQRALAERFWRLKNLSI